mgnify:CR=1 FL=1
MKKLVIIPTYNEIDNISKMIDTVMALKGCYDMLVIDDGSPDGTAKVVKERQAEFPERLHLLERSGKLGLGTAYIMGFKWALERDYDYVFEMDCDFSHNPDDLERLYERAEEGNDVVVGSRYVQGVNIINWPMSRLLLSYTASMYVRYITRMPVCDATAGFVCYSRRALQTLDLDKVQMKGYEKYTKEECNARGINDSMIHVDFMIGSRDMSIVGIKENDVRACRRRSGQ